MRSRLTHSLEVMQTGRYIARSILKALRPDAKALGLENLDNAFVTTVEMACLLHDVGNPPFGHFGEEAIGQWMQAHARGPFGKSHASSCWKVATGYFG